MDISPLACATKIPLVSLFASMCDFWSFVQINSCRCFLRKDLIFLLSCLRFNLNAHYPRKTQLVSNAISISQRYGLWKKVFLFRIFSVLTAAFICGSLLGRPLKGRNIPGCFAVVSRRLHFRVLYGINQFQNQFSRIWNRFKPEGMDFLVLCFENQFESRFHLSETGLYQKVLENIGGAKWLRNIPWCSDPWEGDPFII